MNVEALILNTRFAADLAGMQIRPAPLSDTLKVAFQVLPRATPRLDCRIKVFIRFSIVARRLMTLAATKRFGPGIGNDKAQFLSRAIECALKE
jgi:hypothetical protein